MSKKRQINLNLSGVLKFAETEVSKSYKRTDARYPFLVLAVMAITLKFPKRYLLLRSRYE